jgi:bacteriocin biosynthesis cyclodehydratase domain-containing protein
MGSATAPLIGFKSHMRIETIPGAGTLLISARGTIMLSGTSADRLVPLLDGTRTLAELLDEVSPDLSAGQVGRVLGQLTEANLIGYRPPVSPPDHNAAAIAYWDLARLDGARVDRELTERGLELVALGGADIRGAADACRASGLAVRENGEGPAAFTLVLCADYLDPGLAELNARLLAERRPWLLAKPGGADPWVGPVFRPGAGPCWSCLATRLAAHRRSGPAPQSSGAVEPIRPPEASLPAGRALGLQAAILEAAKWLAGVRHPGQDAVWTFDSIALSGGHHPVVRRPQCRACGDPGLVGARVREPVVPVSRPKAADHGGNGHRALSPAQLLRRYEHLVDPVTGVVAELRRDPGSPAGIHSYLSGQNLALPGPGRIGPRAGLRTQSGGKGATELDAKVSALCEAIERYCGSRLGDEPTVRDSLRELGPDAVHPGRCQLFHERQFRDRARWNATCAMFHRVPEPFDEGTVIDWTPVWSLTAHRHRLLPTGMLYFDAGTGTAPTSVLADSNGNAAGGSLEDAIVQGFLELVERDAVALWWYNRTRHPAVDLARFDDGWIGRLRQAYARMNREVWVLDVTSDLGIPVMAAISRRADKAAEDIMLGFGAHFDPRVALGRALTELGQMLPTVIDAAADGTGYTTSDPHLRRWWRHGTVHNQPYLAAAPEQNPRGPLDYRYTPRADLRDDIDHICALARRNDLDVLVLDQTRPDIGLPVVKVIVPGLRHFWARFAPGRLYDVPVRLGRVAAPTAYEDLNPIPLFL